VTVAVFDVLPANLREDVRALIDFVRDRDGAPPLSDHAMLQLAEAAQPGLRHLVARADGPLTGYAQLDDDTAEIADLVAASDALIAALEPLAPRLLVWSHGKHSPVAPAATARGYVKSRTLWQLRRTLADLPHQPVPAGITLRSFVPGQDEDAWLAVNAAAFADHAEQGRWTRADIEAREAEPWFDPAGFLLAEQDGELVGFHWTKVHPDGTGEVYVLGVSPTAQGSGLGLALLSAGLEYLTTSGVREVLLYVDDSNTAAMRLYRRYGFTPYDLDVQYARAP
jgi:mycothiol synthase